MSDFYRLCFTCYCGVSVAWAWRERCSWAVSNRFSGMRDSPWERGCVWTVKTSLRGYLARPNSPFPFLRLPRRLGENEPDQEPMCSWPDTKLRDKGLLPQNSFCSGDTWPDPTLSRSVGTDRREPWERGWICLLPNCDFFVGFWETVHLPHRHYEIDKKSGWWWRKGGRG